jgi:hypothetical protein
MNGFIGTLLLGYCALGFSTPMTEPEKRKNKCIVHCVETYVHRYLEESYASSDNFVDQFSKLCRSKAELYNCKKTLGKYRFTEKED